MMPTDAYKTTLSLSLDPDTVELLDDFAGQVGMSRSAVVNMMLRGTLAGDTTDVLSMLMKQALASKKEKKRKRKVANSEASSVA